VEQLITYLSFTAISVFVFFGNLVTFDRTRLANFDPRRSLYFRRYIVLMAPWILFDGFVLTVLLVDDIYTCFVIGHEDGLTPSPKDLATFLTLSYLLTYIRLPKARFVN
jgi:hypothetical protein